MSEATPTKERSGGDEEAVYPDEDNCQHSGQSSREWKLERDWSTTRRRRRMRKREREGDKVEIQLQEKWKKKRRSTKCSDTRESPYASLHDGNKTTTYVCNTLCTVEYNNLQLTT